VRLTLPRRRRGFGVAPVPAAVTGPPGPKPRMVPVMRRKIAMLAVLGGMAAGLGCQHIGGKHDCGFHPSDYPIAQPSPPYPSVPASGPVVVPKVVKPGGSDKIPDVVPKGSESGY
jgi:hypothetical protein